MKKRLIDIYPPPTKITAPQAEAANIPDGPKSRGKGKSKISRPAMFAIFLLFLFGMPPIVSHFFFAMAQIQVWPQMTKLRIEGSTTAQIGYDALNLGKNIIRARIFEEERKLTQLFPASGRKMKDEKARGTIRVHNTNSSQSQALVVNTRFISEDGKLFRLEKAASVPASGFIDVQVVAAEPGEQYNIEPSNFSLPGLVGSPLYTKIYGESTAKMAGGAENEVIVVVDEDIASAKDQLVGTLKDQATKSLLAQIPPQFQILEDSITTTILEDSSLVKPGAELDEFSYTARVKVAISGFHKEDANAVAKHFLASYLKENQTINESTLVFAYAASEKAGSPAGGGVIPIRVQIAVDQYEKIDENSLKILARGKTVEEFRQLANENPFLAKIQFSLWPAWIAHIPQDLEKVDIDVHLNSW